MTRTEWLRVARQVRDAIAWHRRLIAALLAGIAVAAGLSAVAPPHVPTVRVWTAARDLTGASPLGAGDVVVRALRRVDAPAGALPAGAAVVGRLLAGPVRRGEPLTDVRLLGPSLLGALRPRGLVAIPVRVADGAAAAALVRTGDVVDVLGTLATPVDSAVPASTPVATGMRVLAVPTRDGAADGDGGGLVVVAATPQQAAALAAAAGVERLSVVLH
jgi:pilus assembly protein CpaB